MKEADDKKQIVELKMDGLDKLIFDEIANGKTTDQIVRKYMAPIVANSLHKLFGQNLIEYRGDKGVFVDDILDNNFSVVIPKEEPQENEESNKDGS